MGGLLCIIADIALGNVEGEHIQINSSWEFHTENIPVAILVWLMIYPMMIQIDFSSIKNVSRNWKGLGLTVFINWLVKPFSMALFAWIIFDNNFAALIQPNLAKEYIPTAILLGDAPCIAMVFVWSYLSKGDANYTLVQVSVNDLILLVAFVPIVKFLLGFSNTSIPYEVLISSVIIFVVLPLTTGYISH